MRFLCTIYTAQVFRFACHMVTSVTDYPALIVHQCKAKSERLALDITQLHKIQQV